ncbi:GntP family permease [Iocasia frigidifontis]|uniref:GntP family permease n=1 Tax=Iocasia fonsfrigidae TaxID=2682810 RepID=A0A8A7K613_9FIRM|nr:SLC13 family permease [Iocasia fonsfrigidae]QTL97146.1 GntP family permease [Iocasia fonsfrigidae]
MDMLVILLGLAILLVLTLRKVPVVYAAAISIIFIAVFSGLPIVKTVTSDYMTGFAGFVKAAWLMLLLGAILSKLMDVSGAASSIAAVIINKFGVKHAIPAIVIAGGLLTFGGVSAFVSCFALYPITLAVFRKANLPRYLIPAAIGSGIFTWVTMFPGNPQIQNIIPSSYLPTDAMAAPVVGVISAAFALVLILVYLTFEAKKAKQKGIGFESDEETNQILAKADEMECNGKLPNVILSIAPIVAIAVVLNVFNQDISVALLSGIVLCAALFFKNITGVRKLLNDSVSSAAVTIVNASAIVAIGAVIKIAPGFQKIVDFILNFSQSGGNPLIIFGVATTLLCGLNASGMGGLSTTLTVLAKPFLAMGVNPDIMHRIGVIASVGLDSLPHSGGIVAILAISGVSYKDGYKHLFVTTVLITLLTLALALVLGNIFYPIA